VENIVEELGMIIFFICCVELEAMAWFG